MVGLRQKVPRRITTILCSSNYTDTSNLYTFKNHYSELITVLHPSFTGQHVFLLESEKKKKPERATPQTYPTSSVIPLTLEFFKVLGVLSGIAGFLETRDAKGSYMWYSDRMTHARRQCSFSMDSGRRRRGRYASRL